MEASMRNFRSHRNGSRLISFDGGGVRGIASLVILEEIMKRVQERMGLSTMPLPADYFELAAGTSAGGINAIMLFRLRMTVEQAKEQYLVLSKEMFRPTILSWYVPSWMEGIVSTFKLLFMHTRFSQYRLERGIDSVVEKYGLDENDRAQKGNALLYHPKASKMFVCTTVQNMMETALLRSYVKRSILPLTNLSGILQKNRNNITIKLAATATSAAPTFFPEVYWKPYGFNHILIFWDGGLLNNNPIVPLWFERHDVVGPNAPEPAISCVISIGTGHKNPSTRRSILCKLVGIASSVMSFATSTSSEDKNFESHMTDLNGRPEHENTKYIRFNPPLEHEIALSDYHRIDELVDLTTKYLQEVSVQKKLEEAVEAICPSKRDSLLSP